MTDHALWGLLIISVLVGAFASDHLIHFVAKVPVVVITVAARKIKIGNVEPSAGLRRSINLALGKE